MAMLDAQSGKPPKYGLRSFWDKLTQPSALIEDIGTRRRAQVMSGMLLLAATLSLIGAISEWNSETRSGAIPIGVVQLISAGLLIVTYGLSRTRYFTWSARLGIIILMLPSYITIFSNPPTDQARIIAIYMWLIVPLLLGSLLLSRNDLIVLSIAIGLSPFLLPLVSPLVTVNEIGLIASLLIVAGALTNLATGYQKWLEAQRSAELLAANRELERAGSILESRSRIIKTSAEISRRLSTILDPQQLTTAVVEQLQSAFNYYHAHIYLFDEAHENLVIVGGTGEAGQTLISQGHKILVSEGLVGRAATTNTAVLVPDVSQEEGWLPNPLLPDTKAETAVPIALGDVVIGVLDVQENRIDGLGAQDVELLESIASQVAIALQNASLFTQHETALASIREEQERAQTILGSITTPTLISGVADGLVLYVNEPLAEMIRVPQEQLMGKVTPDFYADPADREPFLTQIREKGFVENYELNLKRGDGDVFWALVSGRIINYQGQTALLTSLIDIDERKKIEAELQAAHAHSAETLESITVPLVVSRMADGIVAYVNEPMAEVIRVSRDELIGRVTPDFYEDPAKRQGYLAALREHGKVTNYDLRLKRGDGDLFWALISGRVIDFQGEPAIITSVIDINERREAQAMMARRALELETVADVGAVAATILEPDELLQQVVDLTKERFNLYHTHVYILDVGKAELTLTNGAGEVGQRMVAEGRRIALSQVQSLVARAARTREGVVINDVHTEPGFLPHPLLPETRSEMAVPLIAGNQVQGVLDVQADSVNYFTAEDIKIFTTLATQIAVALQNARRYDETQRALDELTRLQRIMSREGWQDYLTGQERPFFGFAFNNKGAKAIEDTEKVTATAKLAENGTAETAIPIAVRGEMIGKIGLRTPDGSAISERKQALIETVAHQVSEALERARLTEQTQLALSQAERRSQEMAVINDIVTQISTSLDLQHSLQIIVDELATAVNVDQVRIALIQPDKKHMLVIAEHFDPTKTDSAVGMTLPLEGNELTLEVINTRQMTVVEDAKNNPRTEPVHALFREQGIETVILLPLVVNDEVIGTVGMDILDKRSIHPASLKMAETIVFQTATAIQNARLFEQIQSALAETEMLYSYSSQLNTATSLDAVLDSAVAPGFQVGATDAMLLVYDRNTVGNPEYAQIAAIAPRNSGRIGESLYLPEQPMRHLWPSSGQNTVFVGDIWADDRLSPPDKETFAQKDIQALAIMYLTVGNLRLGQIIISWNEPQTFTNADERLYGAIAQQASSVVYNRLLFNQTEEALSETAALYQASADLNTAQTFDEVLTSLRQHTILGQGCNQVTINFFDRPWEREQQPEEIYVIARWTTVPTQMAERYKVTDFPEAEQILKPDELIVYQDVATDERLGEQSRNLIMEHYGAASFVYTPLVVAGQWVGFVGGFYPQQVDFSEAQIRRLNVLTRQAAVSLQSIRLYEQTQAALAETEALYIGSESIVLSNSEEDVLRGLIQSTMLQSLDRANVFMFDAPVEDGSPTDVTIVAKWENEGVPSAVQVGTRFLVEHVPFLGNIKPDEVLIVHDVRTDPRVDEQTCQILEGFGMRSFMMYPLVSGHQWLGVVSGQSAKPLFVNEGQVRRATSLVGQAAVVLQTTILFREEQARARKEHLLREIATKVRSSSDIDTIMRTAVTEIGRTLGRRSFITLDNGQSNPGESSHSYEENGAT